MPPLPIPYPEINGHRYSYASIELAINGQVFTGVSAVNYKSEMKASDVYGTAPHKIGRTRGKVNHSFDLEMYRMEWEQMRPALGVAGVGFGETSFQATVCYAELPTSPVVTDVIIGARVEEVDQSNSEGSDPTKVKLTCNVMDILWGTKDPIAIPLKA